MFFDNSFTYSLPLVYHFSMVIIITSYPFTDSSFKMPLISKGIWRTTTHLWKMISFCLQNLFDKSFDVILLGIKNHYFEMKLIPCIVQSFWKHSRNALDLLLKAFVGLCELTHFMGSINLILNFSFITWSHSYFASWHMNNSNKSFETWTLCNRMNCYWYDIAKRMTQ